MCTYIHIYLFIYLCRRMCVCSTEIHICPYLSIIKSIHTDPYGYLYINVHTHILTFNMCKYILYMYSMLYVWVCRDVGMYVCVYLYIHLYGYR
jgi:hypothetical protein